MDFAIQIPWAIGIIATRSLDEEVMGIKDLKEISDMLKELVPEIKFIEAHGQMAASDLEDRMSAFYDRQYHQP